ISMPLWTADDSSKDPYLISSGGVGGSLVNNNGVFYVRDKPFEMMSTSSPGSPTDVRRDIPISADQLFGLGNIPGYKSAFVQRVADPNRPYHPLANPYISVDWNVMDLTIFNGESIELVNSADNVRDENRNALFADNSPYKTTFRIPFLGTITRNQNLITLPNTDFFRGQELGIGSGGSGNNSHFPYYSGIYSVQDTVTATETTF
ncbi:MAG: hypothetical protein Q4G59_03385, partial [Planctomycetia bacterium]|nr:hypothetical protein [Planctomycetia bacterium]